MELPVPFDANSGKFVFVFCSMGVETHIDNFTVPRVFKHSVYRFIAHAVVGEQEKWVVACEGKRTACFVGQGTLQHATMAAFHASLFSYLWKQQGGQVNQTAVRFDPRVKSRIRGRKSVGVSVSIKNGIAKPKVESRRATDRLCLQAIKLIQQRRAYHRENNAARLRIKNTLRGHAPMNRAKQTLVVGKRKNLIVSDISPEFELIGL